MNQQYTLKTFIGPLYITASENGLTSVSTEPVNVPMIKKLEVTNPIQKNIQQAVQQLEEYFKGRRKNFDLKMDVHGTDFQKSVWNELKKIPYGKTCSYTDIAKKINNEAVRAVGSANGKNQFFIVVPCHRVVTANGKLGGYAGGIKMKADLLAFEKNHH